MPYVFPLACTFSRYAVEDSGIRMFFVALTPGPGMPNDLDIFLTDTELAGVANQPQLNTLVQSKLNRKIRAATIASKLDPFIGQTVTVA
jgi:hypothetical protein